MVENSGDRPSKHRGDNCSVKFFRVKHRGFVVVVGGVESSFSTSHGVVREFIAYKQDIATFLYSLISVLFSLTHPPTTALKTSIQR